MVDGDGDGWQEKNGGRERPHGNIPEQSGPD